MPEGVQYFSVLRKPAQCRPWQAGGTAVFTCSKSSIFSAQRKLAQSSPLAHRRPASSAQDCGTRCTVPQIHQVRARYENNGPRKAQVLGMRTQDVQEERNAGYRVDISRPQFTKEAKENAFTYHNIPSMKTCYVQILPSAYLRICIIPVSKWVLFKITCCQGCILSFSLWAFLSHKETRSNRAFTQKESGECIHKRALAGC